MSASELTLRYGCNPHQNPARVFMPQGTLPFTVLSGSPGYINLLDALNSWQLVRELKATLGLPAAASFKHVSPAGAAVAVPMSPTVQKASFVDDVQLSPLANAYARARGADRMSSFGDWAALSDTVDVPTAQLLKREVSDGVIAPGYEPEALAILKAKKGGKYTVIQIDPAYEPPAQEVRDVFGVLFEQKRNTLIPGPETLANVVTAKTELSESARRDLLIAQISLKYTQSNSVCFAYDGQLIGTGAGQQSRVHCVRLAGNKADRWFLRQHPSVLNLKFKADISRAEMNNAIDQYLEDTLSAAEERQWAANFEQVPQKISAEQQREWLDSFSGVALASDAFFPFRDSIDRARRSAVSYVVQPGGAVRDDVVIEACNEYGMVMAFSGIRLFTH
jgi:phosphoribosylaminoimidazolecarboxamide formyltransferase/IMP cyclohydrolase